MSKTLNIFVPAHDSAESYLAIQKAVELCQNLKSYKLTIAYFIAFNPASSTPFIDHLEKSYNMEIEDQSKVELEKCRVHLSENYFNKVDYEFVEVQGEGEVGVLIEQYIRDKAVDLVVCGSRNQGAVKRWIFGSVSEYLNHHLRVPVLIVKDSST